MAQVVSNNIPIVAKKKPPRASQIVLNVLLILLFIIGLYPLFMALVSAFKSGDQYLANQYFITLPLRLENIGTAFERTYGYMLRTIIVAVATTLFMLIVSSMSGFAVAKLDFPGSKILFVV
ncbi:MAG: hypothetical protein SPL13_00755, partial [Clostridia bacterium]|nr:hypothetical protein [Clostridia bacterium]